MRTMLIGATALLLLSTPLRAADKVTPADAIKVISQIQADKEKLKTYCEAQDIFNQAAEAGEASDKAKDDKAKAEELGKKADELSKKADELIGKLGPDYQKLDEAMGTLDPNSEDVKKVAAEFAKLDTSCKK